MHAECVSSVGITLSQDSEVTLRTRLRKLARRLHLLPMEVTGRGTRCSRVRKPSSQELLEVNKLQPYSKTHFTSPTRSRFIMTLAKRTMLVAVFGLVSMFTSTSTANAGSYYRINVRAYRHYMMARYPSWLRSTLDNHIFNQNGIFVRMFCWGRIRKAR